MCVDQCKTIVFFIVPADHKHISSNCRTPAPHFSVVAAKPLESLTPPCSILESMHTVQHICTHTHTHTIAPHMRERTGSLMFQCAKCARSRVQPSRAIRAAARHSVSVCVRVCVWHCHTQRRHYVFILLHITTHRIASHRNMKT